LRYCLGASLERLRTTMIGQISPFLPRQTKITNHQIKRKHFID